MPPQIDTSTKREYRTTIFHIFLKTKKKKKILIRRRNKEKRGGRAATP